MALHPSTNENPEALTLQKLECTHKTSHLWISLQSRSDATFLQRTMFRSPLTLLPLSFHWSWSKQRRQKFLRCFCFGLIECVDPKARDFSWCCRPYGRWYSPHGEPLCSHKQMLQPHRVISKSHQGSEPKTRTLTTAICILESIKGTLHLHYEGKWI